MEQLDSGQPRILQSDRRECLRFMDNFIRMTFPITEQTNMSSTPSRDQVRTKSGLSPKEIHQIVDFYTEPKS